jgi:DNA-binding response OmpR family regulator
VDDQPDLRHIVRVALETANLGLTVITAQDGAEALAFADLERPDVVILDVSMPGMDGFEVCKRLRADARTAFVPILMLTAHNTSEFVAQGFGVGADDYVPKPFRRQDLVARVRRMLERTYGKDAVPAQPVEAATPVGAGIVPGSGTIERLH